MIPAPRPPRDDGVPVDVILVTALAGLFAWGFVIGAGVLIAALMTGAIR